MAGATSCLTTNAFTLKLVKPCSPYDHGWFFLTYGARPNPTPLTCHWGPGIDGKSRMSDNRWLMRFVGETREEGARRPNIKCKAKDEYRFDLWGIPDPRMHSLWISRAKTRVWCVHVWVCMTGGLGSKVRETIHRGRSQRTNNHVEHPGIVGTWAKLKPTSWRLPVSINRLLSQWRQFTPQPPSIGATVLSYVPILGTSDFS